MHHITVETALGKQLAETSGQTVICDADGRALGFFSPLPDAVPVDELRLETPLSIAETEELRKVRTGKPLNEILGRLGLG